MQLIKISPNLAIFRFTLFDVWRAFELEEMKNMRKNGPRFIRPAAR
jgi:hypothetical protein